MTRLIVCAAIRKRGNVICGARHFDQIMRCCLNATGETSVGWEQGFVDQWGVFLDRKEAWSVADAAGQIRRATGLEHDYAFRKTNVCDEGLLFSENLY